jgi:hypothetical protein
MSRVGGGFNVKIYVLAVRQGGGAGAGDGPLSPPAVRAQLTHGLFLTCTEGSRLYLHIV